MQKILTIALLILICFACKPEGKKVPEPHLELGQKIVFDGANPNKSYIIIGYKHDMQNDIDKKWDNQDYIVFVYINNNNDVKEATIHKNAIIKK